MHPFVPVDRTPPKCWEYRWVDSAPLPPDYRAMSEVNAMGADGWRVVPGICEVNNDGDEFVLMEREVRG